MSSDTPTVPDLARQLIEREPVPARAADPAVAAVHAACERLYRELDRWVGSVGARTLLERALRDARTMHPALAAVHILPDGESRIAGVAEAVREDGSGPAAKALEAMLRRLIQLLSRFIGEDLVVNLVNRSSPDPVAAGGQSGEQEE